MTNGHKLKTAHALWISLGVALIVLPACDEKPAWKVGRSSNASTRFYVEAQQDYRLSCERDVTEIARRESLNTIARKLRAAGDIDPDCPLYASKLGEVLLDNAEFDEAARAIDRSLDICDDWVPGWIAKAHWEITRAKDDRAKLDSAESYLDTASAALARLEKASGSQLKQTPLPVWPLQGQTEEKDPDDPTLTDKEQYAWLARWMAANEAWREAEPGWLAPAPGQTVGGISKRLASRLRARIYYERARIADAKGDPVEDAVRGVLDVLEQSRRFDGDFTPTQIERGRQYVKLRDWRTAESLIRPVVDANPYYRNDIGALMALATLYASWYYDSARLDAYERAIETCDRIFKLDEHHRDMWLLQAELCLRRGVETRDVALLKDRAELPARIVLDMIPGDARAQRLLSDIRAAIAKLQGGQP